MADTYKVDVLKQAVFHDGKSMIVLSPKTEKNPSPENPEVEARFIQQLVDEGAISKPSGWKATEQEVPETVATADGTTFAATPSAGDERDPLDHDGNGKKGAAAKPKDEAPE